jgi:hypothetical protein
VTGPEVDPATAKIPTQRVRQLTVADVFGAPPPRSPAGPSAPPPGSGPPRPNRGVAIAILVGAIAIVVTATVVSTVAFSGWRSTLLHGDEKGWLAPIDPRAKAAVAAYKRIFHNMRAMHVAVWAQDDSFGDASSARSSFPIDVTYCLVVRTCTKTTAELDVTVELKHGVVQIESLAKPLKDRRTAQPPPWQVARLSAVVGPRVVVAASGAEAYRLRSVLPLAVAAAAADDRFALWGKPAEYVVYLADSAEFGRWFDADVDREDLGFEINVSPSDLEAVIRLPAAGTENGAGGLHEVVQHELCHVATLQGISDSGDDSLIEGLADYCAAIGHPSWETDELGAARTYIRRGDWSKKIYLTKQIDSRNLITVNAAYAIGYLALHYLADTYGQARMLTFWGDVEHDYDSLNSASEAVFHKSWTSVNAAAVGYIDHRLGV